MFKLTVRIPETLADKAKIRAIKEKTTLQELIRIAVEAYLKGEGR